jgi:NAD(P)-dependent dehydrogenase (short-subunit alcohol dehydrogenase family)
MAQGLKGKVAVVTGAARGIGRAIALRLARDGPAVVVNYAGSAQQAQETVGLIEKEGGRAAVVQADVSKVGDVVRLFDTCLHKYARLDILVSNAGVARPLMSCVAVVRLVQLCLVPGWYSPPAGVLALRSSFPLDMTIDDI